MILTVSGILIEKYIDPNKPPWFLAGLGPSATSLVVQAFASFAVGLDRIDTGLALASCLVNVLINNAAGISPTSSQWVIPVTLAIGALTTLVDSKRSKPFSMYASPGKGWDSEKDETMKRIGIPLWVGALIFASFLTIYILVILLVYVANVDNVYLRMFQLMFRIGSLSFGGVEVVLPLLQKKWYPLG